MQNIDAFLWRRCFLDFGHHARARSKIIKQGIKQERRTHTTVKSRFECAITLNLFKKKNMKKNDATNDRKSQILVLFDVRGCPCGAIALFFWPPLWRDTQKLKILMFSCGVSVFLNCHHAAARSKNHQARPSK